MAAKKRGKKRGGKKATKKSRGGKKRGRKAGRKGKKSARKSAKRKKGSGGGRKGTKKASPRKKTVTGFEEEVTGVEEINKPAAMPTPTFRAAGLKQIKDFLNTQKVKFDIIKHSPAFTAQQIAASAHVPGKHLAKTVIVKIDGKLAMVVEPAHAKVNLDALKRQLNAQSIELANEAEFRSHFPKCELGAMPPLGNLYSMDVYISDNLSHNEDISFNAGTHSELIKMTYNDFFNLVRPKVVYA